MSIYIEIAPYANFFFVAYGLFDDVGSLFDSGIGRRGYCIRVKEGAGGVRCGDASADESLRDERRQVEVRERGGDVNRLMVEPAGHMSSIKCCVSDVKD